MEEIDLDSINFLANLADPSLKSLNSNPKKRLTYIDPPYKVSKIPKNKSCQLNFHYKSPKTKKNPKQINKNHSHKSYCSRDFSMKTPQKSDKRAQSFVFSSTPFEISFQAKSCESPDSLQKDSLEMLDILKDVAQYNDKVLEKATNLLALSELQTSKTTRLSETYRTSVTEKSTIMDRSQDKEDSKYPKSVKTQQMETVKRIYARNEKAKEKLEDLRSLEYEKESHELLFMPKISEKSKAMVVGRRRPLFLRTAEVMKRRKDEIERLKKMREQQNEGKDKELTFKPEILNHDKRIRSQKEIYEDIKKWKERKQEKIQRMNIEIIKKEMDSLTFHPILNDLSKKLVERKKKKKALKEKRDSENIVRNEEETNKENSNENRRSVKTLKGNEVIKKKNKPNTSFSNKKIKDFTTMEIKENKTLRRKEGEKEKISSFRHANNKENNNENVNKDLKITKKKEGERLKSKEKTQNSRSISKNSTNIIRKTPEKTINVVKYEPSLGFLINLLNKR